MGYATRQLSNGFKLLRVMKLFFQTLVLGDVIKHPLHQKSAVVGRRTQHDALVPKPEEPAVTRKHAVLGLKQFLRFLKALLSRIGHFTIFGMDVIDPIARVGEPLRRREPENGLDLRTHVMPRAVGTEFGDIGDGRQTLDQRSIAIFSGAKLGFVSIPLDGQSNEMRRASDELQMLSIGSTRLAVIDSKRPQHGPILRRDGRRPTGAQAVRQRQVTEVRPQRVGRDVGDDNRLLTINGRTARSHRTTNLRTINSLTVFRRQTGSRPMSQSYAISLKKKNGAQHSGMMLFDVRAQGLKGLREWTLAHDHRQYPVIEQ